MAFQRYQARAPLTPDDRITISSAKTGSTSRRIILTVGGKLAPKLGLGAGDRVDIYRGTHSDRELLKLTKDGSDAEFRPHKKAKADGALVLTFNARQWGVTSSCRPKTCKYRQAEDGTLYVIIPAFMRGDQEEETS